MMGLSREGRDLGQEPSQSTEVTLTEVIPAQRQAPEADRYAKGTVERD